VSLPEVATEVRYLDPAAALGAVGWLRVESSAVCGTDVSLYQAGLDWPTVMGHHVVGRITALDPDRARAWSVAVGDLVALEEYLPCQRPDCPECSAPGRYRMCPESDLWKGRRRVGLISAEEGSGLYGGNAEYMQLNANSILHKLPSDLDPDLASWTQPFANAVDWTINAGGAREGSTVVVIGPGYHGIAAVAAARAVGAKRIIAIGRSAERLEIAETLGAEPVVNADGTDLGALINAATGGHGTDLILDTVGLGKAVSSAASGTLRKLGRLVLAGLGPVPVTEWTSRRSSAAPTPSPGCAAVHPRPSGKASNCSPPAPPAWNWSPPPTCRWRKSATCWPAWPTGTDPPARTWSSARSPDRPAPDAPPHRQGNPHDLRTPTTLLRSPDPGGAARRLRRRPRAVHGRR